METNYLIAFALIYTIDSITPGPAVATVVAKGATIGLARTLPYIVGLVLGELVLFTVAIAGLVALAAAMGPIFAIIKWIGIVYLLWLAWKMWHLKPSIAENTQQVGEGWRLLGIGCMMPFGNPRAIGFYVALLPTVMDISQLTPGVAWPFSLVIIIVWTLVLASYALCAERAGHLLNSSRGQRCLNRCAAGTIVGAAGTIAVRQ